MGRVTDGSESRKAARKAKKEAAAWLWQREVRRVWDGSQGDMELTERYPGTAGLFSVLWRTSLVRLDNREHSLVLPDKVRSVVHQMLHKKTR